MISNDTPEQITKSAMKINSAVERDIELAKKIGPLLREYPEIVLYLQLKFAENNTSTIKEFIFNSTQAR